MDGVQRQAIEIIPEALTCSVDVDYMASHRRDSLRREAEQGASGDRRLGILFTTTKLVDMVGERG